MLAAGLAFGLMCCGYMLRISCPTSACCIWSRCVTRESKNANPGKPASATAGVAGSCAGPGATCWAAMCSSEPPE